jgi:hypothetical protein
MRAAIEYLEVFGHHLGAVASCNAGLDRAQLIVAPSSKHEAARYDDKVGVLSSRHTTQCCLDVLLGRCWVRGLETPDTKQGIRDFLAFKTVREACWKVFEAGAFLDRVCDLCGVLRLHLDDTVNGFQQPKGDGWACVRGGACSIDDPPEGCRIGSRIRRSWIGRVRFRSRRLGGYGQRVAWPRGVRGWSPLRDDGSRRSV